MLRVLPPGFKPFLQQIRLFQVAKSCCRKQRVVLFLQENLYMLGLPKANLFCSKWQYARIRRDNRIITSRSQYSRNLQPRLSWKVWTWVVKRTVLREQTVFTSVIFWSCVSHWITLLGVSSLLQLTFSLWKQNNQQYLLLQATLSWSKQDQTTVNRLKRTTVSDKNICDTPLNAVFLLLARLLVLPMLFTAVNTLNLAHQHREGKRTLKCPNSFDWDCSKRYVCVVRLDGHFIAILYAVKKWRN